MKLSLCHVERSRDIWSRKGLVLQSQPDSSTQPALSEAEGVGMTDKQKGRCKMERLNGNRMRLVVVGIVTAIVLGGGSAKADFTFGEPTNLGPTVNSSGTDYAPRISADGLELYFQSLDRPGGYGNCDLYVTTRGTINDPWGEPVNLGSNFNTSGFEGSPSLSAHSLELYFSSDGLPGGSGNCDLWRSTRATKSAPWGPPVNLGPSVNTTASEAHPCISADGLSLYFNDTIWVGDVANACPGGYGGADLWVTTRPTKDGPWSPPQNLGTTINSSGFDMTPYISADGLMLFFSSDWDVGYPHDDIWVARRKTQNDPWQEPVKLGPSINTPHMESSPALSWDCKTLYFLSSRAGGSGNWDLWQAPIIPLVDLNTDGIVDSADMCIMVDHWGTDEPLCDIGPMPWGDGIVDVQDLIVLAEHLFEEIPPAE